MKNLILILTIAIISVYSAFGYTILEDFNDFLVDEDQLTIRLDRAGVLAGSENIRFMIGVEGEFAGVLLDNLVNGVRGGINTFYPKPIVGIGYKNESFGIGFGYQFTYTAATWQAHTPIITATALGDNLRLNVPVTIGIGSGDVNKDDLAVSTDIRLEYYTGNDIFSRIRINLQYGMYRLKANENRYATVQSQYARMLNIENANMGFTKDTTAHSIGIDLRGYFIAATDPILIEPQLRLVYKGSVQDFKGASYSVTVNGNTYSGAAEFGHFIIDATSPMGAWEMDTTGMYTQEMGTSQISMPNWYEFNNNHRVNAQLSGATIDIGGETYYITKPQFIGVSVPVGFTAESDIVSIYLEPALSFAMVTGGGKSIRS